LRRDNPLRRREFDAGLRAGHGAGGRAALASRGRAVPGASLPLLSCARGTAACGYGDQCWTVARIGEVVRRLFGVRYASDWTCCCTWITSHSPRPTYADGIAGSALHSRHRHQEFPKFLREIGKNVSAQLDVHMEGYSQ